MVSVHHFRSSSTSRLFCKFSLWFVIDNLFHSCLFFARHTQFQNTKMATAKKLLLNLQSVTTEECFHIENCNNEDTCCHTSSAFFVCWFFFCFLSCVICPNFAVSNFSSVQLSNIADPLKSKSDQCAGSGWWQWKEANHSYKSLNSHVQSSCRVLFFSSPPKMVLDLSDNYVLYLKSCGHFRKPHSVKCSVYVFIFLFFSLGV